MVYFNWLAVYYSVCSRAVFSPAFYSLAAVLVFMEKQLSSDLKGTGNTICPAALCAFASGQPAFHVYSIQPLHTTCNHYYIVGRT